MRKKDLLTYASFAAIIILIITMLFAISQIRTLSKAIEEQRELIIAESTENRRASDYFNQISSMLSFDLNKTMASLGLPVREYPEFPVDSNGRPEKINSETNVFFDAVEALLETEKNNTRSAMLGNFFRNHLIIDLLEANQLSTSKIEDTRTDIIYKDYRLVSVTADSLEDIKLIGINDKTLRTKTASKEAVIFIENNLNELQELIKKRSLMIDNFNLLLNDIKIAEICGERIKIISSNGDKIDFKSAVNNNTISAWITSADGVPYYKLSRTSVDYSDYNEFYEDLINCLENFDHRTGEEVLVDSALSKIEDLTEDKDFNAYLTDMGLTLSARVREDLDYFYYDLYHINGKRLGAFAVLKKLGEIYLVDSDDIPVSSLKTLRVKEQLNNETKKKLIIPENIPQISDIYSDNDTITFLMIGTHERNTDTMILAHADKRSGEAYMIGIPRDLYWKNRKINSVYQYYGAAQLKKELSEITGLEISNYIVVDMYAFIDIINILGGIEVTLEEDLIDPTYRTRENGEWSTLNYKKGTYNLNGIEALRIARSRHGSNDFDRSRRQQLIIESFLEKFRQLRISDAGKVYSMIQALFEYVDTDFTVLDLISLYNNYGSSELKGSHVLSFNNILYDTYSNIYMLEEDELNSNDDFNKGAWILLPEDNNWNNIRWYVRQIINGELN